MRFINIVVMVAVLASVVVTYRLKHEARRVEQKVAELERVIEDERDAIAVLRAEWSYLNRPERLERLARQHLKMVPLRPEQIRSAEVLVAGGDLGLPRGERNPVELSMSPVGVPAPVR